MHATQNPVTTTVTTPTPVPGDALLPHLVVTDEVSYYSATVGRKVPGNVSRTLRDAALYLTRKGWIQGAYYDQTATSFTPAACLVGAIGMVCYGGPADAPAQMLDDPGWNDFEAAVTDLDGFLFERFSLTAYEFNDAKGRTFPEVVEALNMASRDCGGKESDWDALADGECATFTGVLTGVRSETTAQGLPYATAVLNTGSELVPVLVPPAAYPVVEFFGEQCVTGRADRRGDLAVFVVSGVTR